MRITLSSAPLDGVDTDVLVIGVRPDWQSESVRQLDAHLKGKLVAEVRAQGFIGNAGTVAWFQTQGALPARYVLLAGIGTDSACAAWHALAQVSIDHCRELKAASVAIGFPGAPLSATAVARLTEGLHLGSYTFERLKGAGTPRRNQRLERALLLTEGAGTAVRSALRQARTRAAATCYARDLINLPAAIATPSYLAAEANRLARRHKLRARILDARGIRQAGMGALSGVAQGSATPPRFIELTYRPAAPRRCVALAGKGITFDSGGLSLKSAETMQSQKRDMAGGAVVLAVLSAARELALPVEVRGYVAATENMPGGRALKPGDVVRACNGRTIEVLNTDAEGRLVLADALAYAAAAKPDVLIDVATLTGAVRTALGPRYAGIMGTDPALVRALIAAGHACGENLWELPLVRDYRTDLDSHVADMKNIGNGSAGTIVAGLFLGEFVGNIPWAHIDCSSTVLAEKPFPGHPHGATGFGVRTLLGYLQTL